MANSSNKEYGYSSNGGGKGGPGDILFVPLDDGQASTADPNTTVPCRNDYCVSDEAYLDMIQSYVYPTTFEWVLISLYIVVFIVGLVGNFLVCFVVWRNHHMRTVTNLFIVNLSVADLMVILICLPPTGLEDVMETWYVGSIGCKIIKCFQGVSISVSVLTLTVISVERYYAICYPLLFKSTIRRARWMIILIWTLSFLIIIPELIVLDAVVAYPNFTILLTVCKPQWSDYQQKIFAIFLMVALFFVPLCLMTFAYMQIARCLWYSTPMVAGSGATVSTKRTGNSMAGKSSVHAQIIARRKVAKMLIAVVVMFAVCYFPVHLLNILRYSRLMEVVHADVTFYFPLIAHWMCYLNSASNPVIYNFMSANFRKEFQHCKCRCGHRTRRPYPDSAYSYRYSHTMSETEQITLNTMAHRKEDTYDG